MLALVSALVVAASPPVLAMPGLNGVRLAQGEAEMFSELLATELTRLGVKVMTSRDIASVLGVERQKQLLGCGEDASSCVAELAAGLGANGIIVGDLGRVESGFLLNVKVLAAGSGAPLALFNTSTPEKQLPDELAHAARELARQLAAAWKRPELDPGPEPAAQVSVAAPQRMSRLWAIAPAVVGAAGLGVGIGFKLEAQAQYQKLVDAQTADEALTAKNAGESAQTIGNVALGVGVAGVVAAGVMLFLGDSGSTQPTVMLVPGGATVGLVGALP